MRAPNRREQVSRRMAALEVENWNLKHPVGTPVILLKDSGQRISTKTRSMAEVAASGHAVCWFEGVSGYYLLDRASAIQPESETAHAN